MKNIHHPSPQKNIDMCRYINPFVDYGFKKLFATEANKDILISFLNAVIEDADDPIVELTHKNVEQIGEFNGTAPSSMPPGHGSRQGHRRRSHRDRCRGTLKQRYQQR